MKTIEADDGTYVVQWRSLANDHGFPWRDEEFDAIVAILDPSLLGGDLAESLARRLVRLRTVWVETLGPMSERLHDLVDAASVESGRQASTGEGNPMTAWHDDIIDADAIAEYVRLGGLGATTRKLVLILGREAQACALSQKIESILQSFEAK